jgi:hypothetical protein
MIEGIIHMPLVERSECALDTLEHRPHFRKHLILKHGKSFDHCDDAIVLSLVKLETLVSLFKQMVNVFLPPTGSAYS